MAALMPAATRGAVEIGAAGGRVAPPRYAGKPHGPFRRLLRRLIHFFSYHFILSRGQTRITRAAGFRLTVRPTVFHPRYFISSERFAEFISRLDLTGKRVIDIGTGSGILALAAARAGARHVIATDINPNAALNATDNAGRNGLGDRVTAVCCDLLSALAAAADVRCDPVEPAKTCRRTARSRRSRLACRPALPRCRGVVRPIARAPKPGRAALRHGVVGFRPRPLRAFDRPSRISARGSFTSIRS